MAGAQSVARPPRGLEWLLVLTTIVLLTVLLVVPLCAVFFYAFSAGVPHLWRTLSNHDTIAAIKLTLLVAVVSVAVNTVFGVAAAWAIARYRFPGRGVLLSLIDVPTSVSPVIAGMMFVLVFGSRGLLGPFLSEAGIKVIFATPGIVLVTVFVTAPYVVRELLPFLEAQGATEEEAALTLGASPWRMFFAVTLPKMRWALLYGVILCNARAIGDFGAVSVVSGHIRGETNTLPLHIEALYNDYDIAGAFTVAALLSLAALCTLVARAFLEFLTHSLEKR